MEKSKRQTAKQPVTLGKGEASVSTTERKTAEKIERVKLIAYIVQLIGSIVKLTASIVKLLDEIRELISIFL